MEVAAEPLVSIILVNYNGWQDTIECLESLLKIDHSNYIIVVVDNASSDNSPEFMTNWANGNLDYNYNKPPLLAKYSSPPYSKPVSFTVVEENGKLCKSLDNKEIILVKSKENLGFAGGNNLGTKLLMSLTDQPDYYWYLNNDTVVERCSLAKLIRCFLEHKSKGVKLGVLGSKLKYYHKINTIQAIGALYNPWFATVKHVGHNELDTGQFDTSQKKVHLDYIVGASMFVSKEFLEEVGLMCEDYFLYYEEIDWILRGKQKEFSFTYCAESVVYHKEGSSIGANNLEKTKSALSDYYDLRNRILITQKYFTKYLPVVYLSFLGIILNRIRRRQFDRIPTIIRLILNKNYKV